MKFHLKGDCISLPEVYFLIGTDSAMPQLWSKGQGKNSLCASPSKRKLAATLSNRSENQLCHEYRWIPQLKGGIVFLTIPNGPLSFRGDTAFHEVFNSYGLIIRQLRKAVPASRTVERRKVARLLVGLGHCWAYTTARSRHAERKLMSMMDVDGL